MGARSEYTETRALIQAIEDRAKAIIPQQLIQNWFYYRLTSQARAVKCFDNVEIPLMPAVPTLGKWIGKGSTLPDTSSDQLALATYNNRYLATPTTLNLVDLWEHENNPTMIFQDADFEALKAAWGMRRMLSNSVLNGTGGLQPDGLVGKVLEKLAPASQVQVVGMVDKSSKAWFRNQFVNLTQNFGHIASGTTIPAGILAAQSLIDSCTVGQNVPTDLVTTKAIFHLFRRAMLEMSSAYHLATTEQDAVYGFKSITFDGVKLAWDPQMPDDTLTCVHMGSTKTDSRRSGENSVKYDGDLENATVKNVLELDGGLFMLYNPNVRMRTLEARTPYRELNQTSWLVHSFNIGVGRMSDHGVAGSDNGSRWSTWS